MLRHMAGIAEIVEDVNEALKFYRDTLGLEVKDQKGDDYAVVTVPGVLHFGIWNRAHAAECTLGSRDLAHEIPLGLTLEFEVDNVADASEKITGDGYKMVQGPRVEPWGQKSCRMFSPAGSLFGFAETPWARRITQQMETSDGAS